MPVTSRSAGTAAGSDIGVHSAGVRHSSSDVRLPCVMPKRYAPLTACGVILYLSARAGIWALNVLRPLVGTVAFVKCHILSMYVIN